MKFKINDKILFFLICFFSNSVAFCQLSGYNRVTYGNWKLGENVPKALNVDIIGKIGRYPNWEGLNNIINDVNKAVELKLRSKQPYKVIPFQNVLETNYIVKDTNYTKIENSGNTLILGITLQECNERERDWYFDFYASIYPSNYDKISIKEIINNSEERSRYIERDSKIKRIGNDIKTIEYLNYPSTENYKVVTSLISGPKYKNEDEYQAANNKIKNLGEPLENNSIASSDNKTSILNHGNSNSVEINKSNSAKAGNSTFSDDPSIALNQLIKLKSLINSSKKMTATQKQEALVKLNDVIKQYRDIDLAKGAGDEFLNNLFNVGNPNATFTPKNCWHCYGTGVMKICKLCDGRGIVYCRECNGRKYLSNGRVCLNCSGQGILRCHVCNGKKFNIKCNHKIDKISR